MACLKCLNFIHDTISITTLPNEPFYADMKWKRLQRLYNKIVPLLYKCVCKMTQTDTYILEKSIEYNLKIRRYPDDITQDEIKWFYTYTYLNTTKSPEEASILLEMMEDTMVSHSILCKIWIGYWIDKLTKVLGVIHLEHTTKKFVIQEPPIKFKIT